MRFRVWMRLGAVGIAIAATAPARGHDHWADGSQIPDWVKASCCGPADAHHLKADDVTLEADGYHIKGYPYVIPFADALPSTDGDYWIFYQSLYSSFESGATGVSHPFCFFAPAGA